MIYVEVMDHLAYHSQNTAFITQENKSWASCKLYVVYYHDLSIFQNGIDGGATFMMGDASFKSNSNWGYVSERAHLLKITTPHSET